MTPKPVDTGGVEVGGAVVLEGAVNFEYNCAFIDGTELPLREGESYRITIEPLTEKPTDSMGGETDSITVSPYMPKPGEEAKGLDKDYAVADAPGDVTESVASDGWRSIDSAPKDGTEILAYNDADEYGIAEWSPEDDGWQFASSEGVEYEGVTLVAWKPLDPPTVGEKEAATEANSVTPQGAQATDNPCPCGEPGCTVPQPAPFVKSPQQEKREGPWKVRDIPELIAYLENEADSAKRAAKLKVGPSRGWFSAGRAQAYTHCIEELKALAAALGSGEGGKA